MTMIFLSSLFIIIVSWVLDLKFSRTTLKINLFGLFSGWNRGGWRREERGFCCARNSRRISQSTWDQASEQKFAPKMLQKARRKLIHEKAKHYHKEYRQICRTEIWIQARMARKVSNFYVSGESKLAFVIRIRAISGVSPKVWKGCGFSASVRFSVAPFWSSTRLQLTCWELWRHTLHGGTQTWSQ